MTLAEAKIFWVGYEDFVKTFTESVVEIALKDYVLKDFQITSVAEINSEKDKLYEKMGYKKIVFSEWEEEYNGEWHRDAEIKKHMYTIPNKDTNNINHLADKCLLILYPYLNEFNYFVSFESKQIFVFCEPDDGNYRPDLYVPFEALKTNDFKLIETEMTSYFEDYFIKYSKNGVVNYPTFSTIEEALFSLKSETYKKLKKHFEISK